MSDEMSIYFSRGRKLREVMSNEDYAPKTGLLLDQKHCCINVHYLRVFWYVQTKNVICINTVLKQCDGHLI